MLPTLDEFNEVLESLLKGGTRYRTEKFAVIGVFALVVAVSVFWVVTGIELGRDLRGTFETEGIGGIEGKSFVLENTGSTGWTEVRVVLNDRYLAKLEKLPSEKQERFEPVDFRYYYDVPRPWGHAIWERIAGRAKPGGSVPDDVEVTSVEVRSREGPVRVERRDGS